MAKQDADSKVVLSEDAGSLGYFVVGAVCAYGGRLNTYLVGCPEAVSVIRNRPSKALSENSSKIDRSCWESLLGDECLREIDEAGYKERDTGRILLNEDVIKIMRKHRSEWEEDSA